MGCGLFGVFSFPTLTAMLELVARDFAAIPYSVTNSLMYVCSQIGIIIVQLALGKVLDAFPSDGPSACLVVILYILALILVFVKNIDDEVI